MEPPCTIMSVKYTLPVQSVIQSRMVMERSRPYPYEGQVGGSLRKRSHRPLPSILKEVDEPRFRGTVLIFKGYFDADALPWAFLQILRGNLR